MEKIKVLCYSLKEIGEFCKESGGFLVVTGSYGIAIATKNPTLPHNDLDLQLYFPATTHFPQKHPPFLPDSKLSIEIQNFSFTKSFLSEGKVILLKGVRRPDLEDREFQLPLSKADSTQISNLGLIPLFNNIDVYIKTVPYQIATWIIRLYSKPLFQRRKPQERDYRFLDLLLRQRFSSDEVFYWIRNHPQSFGFSESQLMELEKMLKNLSSPL